MGENGAASDGGRAMDGLLRRELLQRGAIAAASVAGMGYAASATDAEAEPIEIPEGLRSFEAGLALFTARWEVAGPVIRLTRFGQFLSDKVVNCQISGAPRVYALRLGTVGAVLTPGPDPFRHADMVMPEEDWLGILYGDYTGLAAFLSGDLYPSRNSANTVVLLAIVMYVFAHIPAGADPDPDLLLRILQGIVQRGGLPTCEGEPTALEELDRIQRDPGTYIRGVLLPEAEAPPVTAELAEFVHGLRYQDLPPGTVAHAKEQLLSILGAIYAGSRMGPARRFQQAVRSFGDREEATVIGERCFRTSVRHAALLNSVNAQVLEWEDWTFIAHSGASIVPTALAVGELAGASGKELLTAIVAGNEVLARAGEVLTDVIHTGNALAVHQLETPLVAGKLLGLGAGALQDAVGIACTQPQVTSIPAWTADAKGLLTGWPVLTGVEAAQFARAGISGRRDLVESPGGYAYRISDIATPARLDLMIEGLGQTWRFDEARNELFTKRFPTDGFQLTTVQAILDIVNDKAKRVWDAAPRDRLPRLIDRVEVRIPLVMAASASMFTKDTKDIYRRIREEPDWTYIALLFDGKYPVAAALARRRLTWREYLDETIFDPVVQALIDKVDLIPDVSLGVFGAEARVELADGRVFTSTQECIEDFPVVEKLEIGADGILSRRQIAAIARAVERLESFGDVGQFVRLACGGR